MPTARQKVGSLAIVQVTADVPSIINYIIWYSCKTLSGGKGAAAVWLNSACSKQDAGQTIVGGT